MSEQNPQFHVSLRGDALLTSPRFNKGTAFTLAERKAFGLVGRLPYRVNTLDEQCRRAYEQLKNCETPIRQNSFLQSLKDQNWVLYYNEESMEEDFIEHVKGREIDLIVCSDAEAILGIGDQGVGGIGISTAKSVIYTLVGGIDPSRSLSVTLDVGTNNQDLLNDELYVGWQHERVRGEKYDKFIDKFVQLVRKHFPHSLLHFEDFGVTNAQRLLERYRTTHAVFNDDIQGTGAVTLSCLMSAVGVIQSSLSAQRYVIFGAGSAGMGIAHQLRDAIVSIDGVSEDVANDQFYLIDKEGLITHELASAEGSNVRDQVRAFARPDAEWEGAERDAEGKLRLLEVVRRVRPTVLIGTSTRGGAFTEEVVRAMAEGCERPIILPLSNPSALVEVNPSDAYRWSGGKAIIATGSPFPPAIGEDGKEYMCVSYALIYPGLGFGAMLAQSRHMTDTMIIAGARRLASLSPALIDPYNGLLPDFADAPEVNFEVGVAVAEQAIEEGSAGVDWGKDEVREKARSKQWKPIYGEYIHDPEGGR
ncbi:hypothetical protein H0H81_012312 [Sphagnurus paluster]|uniref:Malic enzyme n=1 Tax=Sphagnurus paluster TaxID=117069 RepID=A0A9P7FTW5_9AGAR|nr:hypothetical protein H0H81_012312 [Sphagnurus paluster]